MKTNISGGQHPSRPQTKAIKKPANKDDLDSREGEEQLNKKDAITHNKQEHQSRVKSRNKN
jgi:hypothetical protein